jgi:DNA-binding transcriptional MerR regulator
VEYGIAELVAATGVSTDTIRYYQTLGLLDPPARRGRRAVYEETHREQLAKIRGLCERGFSLKAIREVLRPGNRGAADAVLRTAIVDGSTEAGYSRRQFAQALGIPPALLTAVEASGLAAPQVSGGGEPRYSEADLAAARGALKLLERGLPLNELLALAVGHHRAVSETVDRAIDLFDDHVRKRSRDGDTEDAEEVARAYRELLPVVTALVAHHFQRVLVNRALERLEHSGERRSWRAALRAVTRMRLNLRWR